MPGQYKSKGSVKIYDPGPLTATATSITVDLTKLTAPKYLFDIHINQAGTGSVYSLKPNGSTTNIDMNTIYRDFGGAPGIQGADANSTWQLGGVAAGDELHSRVELCAELGNRRVVYIKTTIFALANTRTFRQQLITGWFNDKTTPIATMVINSDTAANGIGIGSIVRAWAIT